MKPSDEKRFLINSFIDSDDGFTASVRLYDPEPPGLVNVLRELICKHCNPILHSDLLSVFSGKIIASQVIIPIGPPGTENYQAGVNWVAASLVSRIVLLVFATVPTGKLTFF
jgi:hypothetical protein